VTPKIVPSSAREDPAVVIATATITQTAACRVKEVIAAGSIEEVAELNEVVDIAVVYTLLAPSGTNGGGELASDGEHAATRRRMDQHRRIPISYNLPKFRSARAVLDVPKL
jgi:hypothetical protein